MNIDTLNKNVKLKFNEEYKIRVATLKQNKSLKEQEVEKFVKKNIIRNVKLSKIGSLNT